MQQLLTTTPYLLERNRWEPTELVEFIPATSTQEAAATLMSNVEYNMVNLTNLTTELGSMSHYSSDNRPLFTNTWLWWTGKESGKVDRGFFLLAI